MKVIDVLQIPPHVEGSAIILSILPVESPGAMYERFLPLKYYLEKILHIPVTIQIARNYESAIQGIGSGKAVTIARQGGYAVYLERGTLSC